MCVVISENQCHHCFFLNAWYLKFEDLFLEIHLLLRKYYVKQFACSPNRKAIKQIKYCY